MKTALLLFATIALANAQSLPLGEPVTQGDVTLMLLPVIIPGGIGLPGVSVWGEYPKEVIGVIGTADPLTNQFVVSVKTTDASRTQTIIVNRSPIGIPTNFVLMLAAEDILSISIIERKPEAVFGNQDGK